MGVGAGLVKSSRSLSHLLMSFLFLVSVGHHYFRVAHGHRILGDFVHRLPTVTLYPTEDFVPQIPYTKRQILTTTQNATADASHGCQ